ncbi:HPr kinase [Caballeronia hypogeia]|uniref:3-oxo-tetronate kinase n=1 Tax=Caballeronia hypogeia TaxID=1777140 RepID=A0A158CC98_9BURK|nr:3-oxo-tetronate kinase [Caballeronia hypogeia]SAK79891.1 HPr kinase [Caballeronia hypogeia]
MSKPLLGCIADDFTGGTDLASTLVRGGMRVVQVIGVPRDLNIADADAVVIALKTRTVEAAQAVKESLDALDWLEKAGCEQFFFKYCSTFDSTPEGNIGPVADALASALGVDFAIACPAFPENGRTIYKGYLYVGDVLLSESGMRNHPLTPMSDANLVRVLQSQTQAKVGAVHLGDVSRGAEAIVAKFEQLRQGDVKYAIVDAVSDADLCQIGRALMGHRLITGGSGVAMGLPANFRDAGKLSAPTSSAAKLPRVEGRSIVLSGSCSLATNAQVEAWKASSRPAFKLDPLELAKGDETILEAVEWATQQLESAPVLIYGSANPDEVKRAQRELGVEKAGSLMERALAQIAKTLVDGAEVRKVVVAGGETSGAVVKALDVKALRIGAPIDPGVPWTIGTAAVPLALALKSGNFGTEDFFEKALRCAP